MPQARKTVAEAKSRSLILVFFFIIAYNYPDVHLRTPPKGLS